MKNCIVKKFNNRYLWKYNCFVCSFILWFQKSKLKIKNIKYSRYNYNIFTRIIIKTIFMTLKRILLDNFFTCLFFCTEF